MKRKRAGFLGGRKIAKRRRTVPVPRNIIRYQQTRPGGEIKSIDILNPNNGAAQASFTINQTGLITPLNIITLGNSSFNRSGRKLSMRSIHLQGFFALANSVANAVGQFARIAIVYDKQTNGALPTYADIFTDQINNTGGDVKISSYTSGLNLNNRDRFEIILDRRFFLPTSTVAGTASNVTATADMMHVELFKRLRNREVHFKADSTPGVITDIATGSLLLVTIGDVVAGSEFWNFFGSLRLRYSDL